MAITFTPSLCESLSIPVSSWDIHTGGYVKVKFRATLSVEEFQRLDLGNGGSQVQVWSDFPSSPSREGEWYEMDFEVDDQDTHQITLSCVFNVPLSTTSAFSFTYRIFHHSGSWVEWLGSFAQNGVVRIFLEENSYLSSPNPALVLGEGWVPSSLASRSSLSYTSEARHTLTVKDEDNWRLVSAVGRDGYSTSTVEGGASMLFLVPKRHDRDSRSLLIRPHIQMFAVAADPESTLLFSPKSEEIEVTAMSSGEGVSSLVLQTFVSESSSDSDVDSIWDSLVRHSFNLSQNRPRLVSLDDGKRMVALTSSPKTFPVELTLFPLTRWRDAKLVSMSEELGLASLFEAQYLAFAILSDSQPTPKTIGITTLNYNSDSQIRIPTSKPVKLSPFTPLSPNDSVSICVLTPHQSNNLDLPPTYAAIGTGNGDEEALPTPPPSPQLRPIAHLKGGKGNESMASISDIGILSRVDTPASTPTVSRLDFVRQISISSSSSSSSSSKRGSSKVLKRPTGLIPYLRHFFFTTSFFLIIVVRRFLFGGGRKKLSPRRWGIGSGTARYHSPSGSGYVTPNRESGREGEEPERDETTQLLSETSQSQASTTFTSDPAVNDNEEEAPLPSPSPSPSPERKSEREPVAVIPPSPSPLATSNVLYFTRSFELLDTPTTVNHALVLRGIVDFKLSDKVKFEVDDQPVSISNLKSIQGEPDAWFVELEWRKTGRLTVTYCA